MFPLTRYTGNDPEWLKKAQQTLSLQPTMRSETVQNQVPVVNDPIKRDEALNKSDAYWQKVRKEEQRKQYAVLTNNKKLVHEQPTQKIAAQIAEPIVERKQEFAKAPIKESVLMALDLGTSLIAGPQLALMKAKPIQKAITESIIKYPMRDNLLSEIESKYGKEYIDYLTNSKLYKEGTAHSQWKYLDEKSYNLGKSGLTPKQYIDNDQQLQSLWKSYQEDINDYYYSPKFEERFNKSFGGYRDIDDYRNETMSNLTREPLINDSEFISKDGTGAFYKYDSNPKKLGKNLSDNTPTGHAYFRNEKPNEEFVFHEMDHQRTNSDEALPFHLTDDYIKDNFIFKDIAKNTKVSGGQSVYDYLGTGTEFNTRLNLLRKDAARFGYDKNTMDLTEEHLNMLSPSKKYLLDKHFEGRNLGQLNDAEKELFIDMYEDKSKYQGTKDLFRHFKRDFILKEANTLPSLIGGIGSYSLLNKYKK